MNQAPTALSWICVHDVHRKSVDDVEPCRIRDVAVQLRGFNLRATDMLYGWMVEAGPEGKPYVWVRYSTENRLREWANVYRYGAFNNQAAKELQEEQMHAKHGLANLPGKRPIQADKIT